MGSNFFQHRSVGEIRAGLINYITMQQRRFCKEAPLLLNALLKIFRMMKWLISIEAKFNNGYL